jgi:ubiquinone/menaquinone biosynthesis C-methylase UbiE
MFMGVTMAKGIKDRVIEQFTRNAKGYVGKNSFSGGKDLEAAAELLKPTADDLLLDVATGGGHTALFFSPMVRSVVASDLTMTMLKRAQEYIGDETDADNIVFRVADAEDLPFPSGSFTIVTCRIAPHHFPDIPKALSEMYRVLRRKTSRIAIIDTLLPEDPEIAEFYQQMEALRDPTHIQAYTCQQWTTMVEEAGFKVEQTAVFPKVHDFQSWARRAGLDDAGVSRLNDFFVNASDKIQDFFKIEIFAGEVESYCDNKLLVYAKRVDNKN